MWLTPLSSEALDMSASSIERLRGMYVHTYIHTYMHSLPTQPGIIREMLTWVQIRLTEVTGSYHSLLGQNEGWFSTLPVSCVSLSFPHACIICSIVRLPRNKQHTSPDIIGSCVAIAVVCTCVCTCVCMYVCTSAPWIGKQLHFSLAIGEWGGDFAVAGTL
jgi:hypothetical protein